MYRAGVTGTDNEGSTPPARTQEEEWKWFVWEDRIKSIVLFIVGVGAFVREVLMEHPRPEVLVFVGSVLGIVPVIEGTRRGRKG